MNKYIVTNIINEDILLQDLKEIINNKLYRVIELLELKLDDF